LKVEGLVIEDRSDLAQCEHKLSKEAQNVSLLGEIPLSPEDLDHLATLIRQAISPDISVGTRFLERKVPACLAAVRESTGLVEDPNWERKWGRIFLNFLKTNDLPCFEIKGGLAYVTPILAHGGIPNSCLDEFFEKVLLPMVQRDLNDPTDPEEIINELTIRREDDEEQREVERQYDDLQRQARYLKRNARLARRSAKAFDEVIGLWRLEESISRDALANLPEDYEAFRDRRLAELSSLEEKIHGFEPKRTHWQQVVASFTEQDKQVLAQAEAIERSISEYATLKEQVRTAAMLKAVTEETVGRLRQQSAGVFSKPWSDEHGELLSQLPFDRLREEIERLDAFLSREAEGQIALSRLRALPDTASRNRSILSVVSMLLGLILIVSGVQLLLSWVLIITGIGFTVVAGMTSWSWYRRRTSRQKQLELLKQAVREVTREQLRVRANISRILSGLPIAEQQLRSPSTELYQALISLVDVYRELSETHDRWTQIEQEIQQQAQRIEQTATNMGINDADNLDDLVSTMKRALEQSRARQAAAVRAEQELKDNIQPKIAEIKAEHRVIRQELAWVKKRLVELGGGDIQAGIRQMETQRQQQEMAVKLRAQLKEKYPDLAAIEREIRSAQRSGKDKSALEAKARQITEQLEQARAQADRVKQELAYYPTAFPGVDEPIRRYLLYGGKSAEEFLVNSVLLAHRSLTDQKVPNADDVGLPKRVVMAFECWWAQHIDELREQIRPDWEETATGQRFRTPTISLDPAMAEITVHVHAQRYLASVGGTSALLEVMGSTSDSLCQTFPLRVYGIRECLLETQDLDFPLSYPDYRYEFSLKSDGSVIQRWEVTAMRKEGPCIAFNWPSGKLIKDEELPGGRIWFLVRQGFSPEPADCILVEGRSLYGKWKEYDFLELDLEQVDELQIVDDQGQRFPILVSSGRSPVLEFIGGQWLEGVHSEGVEICVGSPPQVRIPIEDEAELRLWRLSILTEEESSLQDRKHYRLSELQAAMDVDAGKGWVDVLLTDETLLGQRPVGVFTVRVRKPPYTDWRSTFCIVPNLQVEFDRDIYLPCEAGKTPKIHAKILVAEGAEFAPDPPAELLEARDNFYAVRINGAENVLRGTLLPRLPGGNQRVPLTVNVPKVKWRLQGLEDDQQTVWCDTVEEVWLGDWETASELFLIVALPSRLDGYLELSLDGKKEKRDLRGGRARFDLLAFMDALRAGPSIQTFTLTLPESQFAIDHTPLFKVRTRWEVEDVECIQESRGRTIILNVTWTEKGRTGNRDRVVRLWSPSGVLSDPIIPEEKVWEGTSVTLRASVRDLPPGTYLLQLALEDPWSTTEVSRPALDDPNTRVIVVVPIGDLRQGQILSICSIADDDGQLYQLGEGACKIRIVGKIINRRLPTDIATEHVRITRNNEGWYVGNIEVVGDPELEVEVDQANPVKFDYDISKDLITAIEDKEGEGAMYCRRCRKLYWSEEVNKEEERKEHPIFGPVEVFNIHWES
jgi:hypothetical protein